MTRPIYLTNELLIPHILFLIAAVLFIRQRRSIGSILFFVGVLLSFIQGLTMIVTPIVTARLGFPSAGSAWTRLVQILLTFCWYAGGTMAPIGLLLIANKARGQHNNQVDASSHRANAE